MPEFRIPAWPIYRGVVMSQSFLILIFFMDVRKNAKSVPVYGVLGINCVPVC